MTENLFVNRRLKATRMQVADGMREVIAWLDRLSYVLELGVVTDEEAYDLLAHREKLRRVRPELLEAARAAATLQTADELIAQRGRELAQQALCIPNPQAWLEEAERLEASYETTMEPSARADLAARLLDDLDDAELALVAAARLGIEDKELAEQLEECVGWLAEHADAFLAASVYVQSIGLALRADLEETDYLLAATALKFVDILRAAEEAERELALEYVTPLADAMVDRLYEGFLRRRAAIAVALPCIAAYIQQSRHAGAFGGSTQEPVAEFILKWVSPTQDWVAYLPLGPEGQNYCTLYFYTANGEPALGLANQTAFLGGVPAQISSSGTATFAQQDLPTAAEKWLDLEVGVERTRWELQIE